MCIRLCIYVCACVAQTLASSGVPTGGAGEEMGGCERVVVFERRSGKIGTGPLAPTEATLFSLAPTSSHL